MGTLTYWPYPCFFLYLTFCMSLFLPYQAQIPWSNIIIILYYSSFICPSLILFYSSGKVPTSVKFYSPASSYMHPSSWIWLEKSKTMVTSLTLHEVLLQVAILLPDLLPKFPFLLAPTFSLFKFPKLFFPILVLSWQHYLLLKKTETIKKIISTYFHHQTHKSAHSSTNTHAVFYPMVMNELSVSYPMPNLPFGH